MKIKVFSSANRIHQLLCKTISFEQEEFWTLALNSQLNLISAKCLFRGTVDHCLIHPRDIFRYAFEHNASQIVLCHSHPSGQSLPSKEDINVTLDLVEIGKLMKVPVIDHVILCKNNYFSFKEKRIL